MQNNNKKAFSLIIAMFLMIITSLLALYLLEYIIPFIRNTKWMENWTKAYYEANKWIEDVLFSMKDKDAYFETGKTDIVSYSSGYYYSLVSTWSSIPLIWDWTSEFDTNYNKISISNPVQLLLKWSISIANWANVKFYFKVPQFDDSWSDILFSWWTSIPIINWQLSSNTETLNSSWSQVMYGNINSSTWSLTTFQLSTKDWYTLAWSWKTFSQFYAEQNCNNSGCILKLSVVNELKTNTWKKIPYLEYKIEFPVWIKVANYYGKINSHWKSTWYRKDLKLYIPQQTTIEAFDFTVFQ